MATFDFICSASDEVTMLVSDSINSLFGCCEGCAVFNLNISFVSEEHSDVNKIKIFRVNKFITILIIAIS